MPRRGVAAVLLLLLVWSLAAVGTVALVAAWGGGRRRRPVLLRVVVARYREDLDAVAALVAEARAGGAFRAVVVRVYDKGPEPLTGPWPAALTVDGPVEVVALPNVGRCDHTYLHHVVATYPPPRDETTLFLPASVGDGYKRARARHVLAHLRCAPGASVLVGMRWGAHPTATPDFALDAWRATNAANQTANPETHLQPAPVRPLGRWLAHHGLDPAPPVVAFGSLYALAAPDVWRRPRAHYERFLAELAAHSNPEAGHYVERAWAAIHGPLLPPASLCADPAACPLRPRDDAAP